MHKKVEKFVFRPKRLYKAKNGQISKTPFFSRTRERKSPIHRKGLFRPSETSLESQLHASEELYARDRIIIVQLVLLVGHIIEQSKGRHLVVDLVVGT